MPALNEEQWKEVREIASVDLSRARQASSLSRVFFLMVVPLLQIDGYKLDS